MPNVGASELVAEQIEVFSSRHPGWLIFPSSLEQAFELDGALQRSRRMWQEGLISIVIFDSFFLLDKLLLRDMSWVIVLVQLALVTPMALLVNDLVRRNPSRRVREGTVALATCLIAGVYLWMQQDRDPVASAYGAVGVIVTVSFANAVMRLRFRYALAASAVILGLDLIFLLRDQMLRPAQKILGGTLTTIAIGITIMANYSLEREERLGYLARRRIELQTQDLEVANEKLARLSTVDSLTGLPNRHSFDDRFNRLWEEAAETGAPLSAIMVDIDHFKLLNDMRGHRYGDEVLRRVASLLPQALRVRADFAARFGGEEFVVLLPATGRESAMLVAERIRQLVQVAGSPVLDLEGEESMMWVTVSCGVSTCIETDGYNREELLESADQGLYAAKTDGRNVVRWKEMDQPGTLPNFIRAGMRPSLDCADDLRSRC